jgi:hypothetical protein
LQPLSELLRNPAADDWKWPARNWASLLQDARVRHARGAVRLRDQTSLITLWGSGKVHVHRAPAEVFESQKKLYGIPNVRSVEEFSSRSQKETTNPTDPVDVNEFSEPFSFYQTIDHAGEQFTQHAVERRSVTLIARGIEVVVAMQE